MHAHQRLRRWLSTRKVLLTPWVEFKRTDTDDVAYKVIEQASISGDCAGGGGGIEKWASSASRVDTGRKDGLPASLHAEARM